ncbi:MAG: glycosyltransferase family 2 protein [Wenzhouxiangella sp.]
MTSETGKSPRTTVVIPNWNGAHHLPDCLDSLRDQTQPNFEVIVVDNGSTDHSIKLLETAYAWVKVIALSDNRGFSAAVNAGIRASSSEFIVLLNNDTRAQADWLERLVEAMTSQPDAAFGASKMLLWEPPHNIDSAGDRFSLWRGVGDNIGSGMRADSHSEPAWVFGACAGAAIYRRSLFDAIGLFDEDFFLVFEDVDFDLRAQVAGYRCLYIPDAIVYHKRGASTDNTSIAVMARSWRNALWVAGKNLPLPLLIFRFGMLSVRMSLLVGRALIVRGWRSLVGGQEGGDRESGPRRKSVLVEHYLPAFRQALKALPGKRREVRHCRQRNTLSLLPILLRPSRPVKRSGIR